MVQGWGKRVLVSRARCSLGEEVIAQDKALGPELSRSFEARMADDEVLDFQDIDIPCDSLVAIRYLRSQFPSTSVRRPSVSRGPVVSSSRWLYMLIEAPVGYSGSAASIYPMCSQWEECVTL